MRILQVSRDFSISGGVGKYLNHLVRGLADAGHSVEFVQAAAADPATWPCGVGSWTVPHVDAYDARLRPTATRDVLDLLAQIRPEVVHAHGGSNFELDLEMARRVPFVKTLHTLELCPTGQRYHHLTRRICRHRAGWACLPRIVYKRCTLSRRPAVWWQAVRRALAVKAAGRAWPAVVVTSGYACGVAVADGLPATRVHVIPYFTDMPGEVTPPPNHPRILFAGRVFREKGLDLLLRAAALLRPREIAIDVVGDGPALAGAKALADRFGLLPSITFHGWQQDMDPFYRRASLVVVPSRLAEPFGIVGIEAMSHARPVVAFAVGGIPDWLQDGVNGFLVPPEEIDEMAARIGELVDYPERCRSMGLAGRQIALERYTVRPHVARLVALYEQVARG